LPIAEFLLLYKIFFNYLRHSNTVTAFKDFPNRQGLDAFFFRDIAFKIGGANTPSPSGLSQPRSAIR
jgi:hypothetical protein